MRGETPWLGGENYLINNSRYEYNGCIGVKVCFKMACIRAHIRVYPPFPTTHFTLALELHYFYTVWLFCMDNNNLPDLITRW